MIHKKQKLTNNSLQWSLVLSLSIEIYLEICLAFKQKFCALKIFQRNLDVKIHIDGVHLKLKNFHCHVVGCNKSFSVKSSLQRHIKIVHDKMKPYSCPDCDSLFSTGHQLKLHKERAHDKIRHNCAFDGCTKNYSDPSNLKRHVKNKHQNWIKHY